MFFHQDNSENVRTQQIRYIQPMLVQHWLDVSCFLGGPILFTGRLIMLIVGCICIISSVYSRTPICIIFIYKFIITF